MLTRPRELLNERSGEWDQSSNEALDDAHASAKADVTLNALPEDGGRGCRTWTNFTEAKIDLAVKKTTKKYSSLTNGSAACEKKKLIEFQIKK